MRQGGESRAHAAASRASPRCPVGWCRLLALCLISAPAPLTWLTWPRLPARPGAGRGPLLGLVAPSRLELLQQRAARRLADPRRLRSAGLAVAIPATSCSPCGCRPCCAAVCCLLSLYVLTVQVFAATAGLGCRRLALTLPADRRRLVAHDHRRAVHLLLGLGAGAGIGPSSAARRGPGRSSAWSGGSASSPSTRWCC